MDWNGDGKHDCHDDAFIHNVLNNDDDTHKSDPNSHWTPSGGVCIIGIIILIIISFFL